MKRFFLRGILLCCSPVFTCGSYAQFNAADTYKFKTYTAKDGLVHNYTVKCTSDSKGFLWIITQHGLSRFDGVQFKNFEHNVNDTASLPENDLEDIATDRYDRIWLSYKTGMCFYDQSRRKFYIINCKGRPIPSHAFAYDSVHNCMWAANYLHYYRIDCASLQATEYTFEKPVTGPSGIEQVYVDRENRVWILMDRHGYYLVNSANNSQYYFNEDIWPMQIYEDDERNIWMTTWSSGFRKINITGQIHHHTIFPDPFIPKQDPYNEIYNGITESRSLSGRNILWIAKATQGLILFDKEKEKFVSNFKYDANIKNGIATNFNNRAFTDRNGIIWLCTWHGLTKINHREQQFNSRELPFLETRNYNRLSGLVDDPYDSSIIWFGIEGSGLLKYDKRSGKPLQKYYNDAGTGTLDINDDWRWVKMMFTDSRRVIWAAASGGLLKIDRGIVSKHSIQSNGENIYPLAIAETNNGQLWLATARGLVAYNTRNNEYKLIQQAIVPKGAPAALSFRDLIRQDKENLLLTGKSGTYYYHIPSGTFTRLQWHIASLDSAGQQNGYCIEKINNRIYTGTASGLIEYNIDTKASAVIGAREGIDNVYYSRLKKDSENNLWIFTSHALYKCNPLTRIFEQFTTGDGIYDFSNDQIGFFKYGQLFYIGYRMAMTSFDPLAVNINNVKSTPVITEIDINGRLLPENIDSFSAHSLQLPYRRNNISFSFTAADFTNSDKITFAFRLDGYDKDRVYSGTTRTANYTNLRDGKYIFKVWACNSSGVWNDTPQTVFFTIATPAWQTVWFYMGITAFIFFIAYLLYRRRLQRLVELFKIRDAISKNIHDEIGATLSSINIYSDVARKKAPGTDTGLLLERIYKASGQVMESMNDIVWYVNPKNDTWDNIIVRMREYAIPLLEAKNIGTSFEADESLLKQKLDMQQRQHVYFIFKEAINNIVKYAGAKKTFVRLYKKEKKLLMLIEDDGTGFDIKEHHSGNGLVNMQQRAEYMNGRLFINTEKNKGTLLRLEIPIT